MFFKKKYCSIAPLRYFVLLNINKESALDESPLTTFHVPNAWLKIAENWE